MYKRQFCPTNLLQCIHFKGTGLVHNPVLSLTIVQVHAGPTASWVGAPHASVCISAVVPGNVSNIGRQRDCLTSQALHMFPTEVHDTSTRVVCFTRHHTFSTLLSFL